MIERAQHCQGDLRGLEGISRSGPLHEIREQGRRLGPGSQSIEVGQGGGLEFRVFEGDAEHVVGLTSS